MQLTFTVGRDTSQPEYQRLIAALVVLGDVRVPDTNAQGELLLPEAVTWEERPADQIFADMRALKAQMDDPSPPFVPAQDPVLEARKLLCEVQAATRMPTFSSAPPPPPPAPEPPVPTPPPPPMTVTHVALVETPPDPACTIDTTTLGFGAPPPPPVEDPDVDAHGVRYDADIHTAKRSKNGDGGWRLKPGVDKTLVERKLAEQKRIAGLPVSSPVVSPPPPPPAPTAPTPPPPPPPPTAAPTTPPELFKWATGAGKTASECAAAALQVGLVDAEGKGSIGLLLSRPDAVAAVYAALGGAA